jgi:hypothetical protein
MKKVVVIIAALCAALVVVGCASAPSASDMMSKAKNSAPSGALVGQATGNTDQKADSDAKYQLVRGMSAMVKDMVDAAVADKTLQAGAPTETFRQGVVTALTRISLSSAKKLGSGQGSGKVYWAVYSMDKSDVTRVLTQAVNASKQLNASASAFTIDKYINAAYANQSGREWKN